MGLAAISENSKSNGQVNYNRQFPQSTGKTKNNKENTDKLKHGNSIISVNFQFQYVVGNPKEEHWKL